MISDEKRKLENELLAMGLPSLDDPNLVQVMADLVNGYPIPGERAEFFCELLNECEGRHRRDMYEALRPRLSFDVPTLDQCEARIAARAERLIRPGSKLPGNSPAEEKPLELAVELTCGGCKRAEEFTGRTIADAMGNARKAGWGRGAKRDFLEYCAECRLASMPQMGSRESAALEVVHALEA